MRTSAFSREMFDLLIFNLLAGLPKAPLPPGKGIQGIVKMRTVEIRP